MAIFHLVLFQFIDGVSAEVIDRVCKDMMALGQLCVHPDSNKPYIKSVIGGRDHSYINLQCGITHAFVVEFGTREDFEYYLEKDSAHAFFAKSLDGCLAKGQVIDFTGGVF